MTQKESSGRPTGAQLICLSSYSEPAECQDPENAESIDDPLNNFRYAKAEGVNNVAWTQCASSFADFAACVRQPTVIRSLAEKKSLPYFVPAVVSGNTRSNKNVVRRTGATLDIDETRLSIDQLSQRIEKHGLAAAIYTTVSARPDKPRYRIVVPSAPYAAAHTKTVTRNLARQLDLLEDCDMNASGTASQAMFLPAKVGDNGHYEFRICEGVAYQPDIAPSSNFIENDPSAEERYLPAPYIEGPLEIDDLMESEREIVERYYSASNENAALWAGDAAGYGDDHSAADAALVGKLARFCDFDPNLIDRLFRASALWRDKWDAPRGNSTYGARTVARVLASIRSDARQEFAQEEVDESEQVDTDKWIAMPSRPKPIAWLIHGLLAATPHVCIVYAPRGSYKTSIATCAGMHIASGRPFCGLPVRKGSVWYVAAEDTFGMAPRVYAQLQAWNDRGEALQEVADEFAKRGDFLQSVMTGRLTKEAARKLRSSIGRRVEAGAAFPSLVVLDTLTRLIDGDPSAAAEANTFIERAESLARKFNCPVLVVAHPPKDTISRRASVAGSHVFESNARGLWQVELDGQTGVISLRCEKVDGAAAGKLLYLKPEVIDLAPLLDLSLNNGETYTGVVLHHVSRQGSSAAEEFSSEPVKGKSNSLDLDTYLLHLNENLSATCESAAKHLGVSVRKIQRLRSDARQMRFLDKDGRLTASGRKRAGSTASLDELLG